MSAIRALIEAAKESPPGASRGGRLGSLADRAAVELDAMEESSRSMFKQMMQMAFGGDKVAALREAIFQMWKNYEEVKERSIRRFMADSKLTAAFEEAASKTKFSVTNDWPRLIQAFAAWRISRDPDGE